MNEWYKPNIWEIGELTFRQISDGSYVIGQIYLTDTNQLIYESSSLNGWSGFWGFVTACAILYKSYSGKEIKITDER
jgi:hypothetical protein